MHAPPPHGFYGINEIHFSKVSVDKTHVEGGRLGQLAGAIPSHLSQEEEEYSGQEPAREVPATIPNVWARANGCKRIASICL